MSCPTMIWNDLKFPYPQNDDVDDIDSIIQEVNAITGETGVQLRVEKNTGKFTLPVNPSALIFM